MLEVPDALLPLKTSNLAILSCNSEVFLDPHKWLGNFSEKLWVRNPEAFIIDGEIIRVRNHYQVGNLCNFLMGTAPNANAL
jgi:hypothetical protein